MKTSHRGCFCVWGKIAAVADVRCIRYTGFGATSPAKLRPGIILKLRDHVELISCKIFSSLNCSEIVRVP